MTCIPGLPVTCLPGLPGPGDAAGGLLGNGFATAMRDGAGWVIKTTIGWWIDVPAVDLATSPAATIRSYHLWISLVVAAAGVIWQGILMTLSRRAEPALAVGRGLFLLAVWTF